MNKIKQTKDEKKEYQKMILNKSENHLLFNPKIINNELYDLLVSDKETIENELKKYNLKRI